MKGVAELDDRVDALEKRVAALEPKKADAGRRRRLRRRREDDAGGRGEEDVDRRKTPTAES